MSKSFFDRRIARPFIFLLVLNFVGLGFRGLAAVPVGLAASRNGDHEHGVDALQHRHYRRGAARVSREAEQNRLHVRVAFRGSVLLGLKDGRTLQADTTDLSNSGVALRVPRGIGVAAGETVTIRFAFRFIRHDLPATVVGYESGRLRLKFAPLTLAQEEELTRVLYSRADSWLNFSEHRDRDRSLQSLGLLVKLSFRGLGAAIRSFWDGGPASAPVGRRRDPQGRHDGSLGGAHHNTAAGWRRVSAGNQRPSCREANSCTGKANFSGRKGPGGQDRRQGVHAGQFVSQRVGLRRPGKSAAGLSAGNAVAFIGALSAVQRPGCHVGNTGSALPAGAATGRADQPPQHFREWNRRGIHSPVAQP